MNNIFHILLVALFSMVFLFGCVSTPKNNTLKDLNENSLSIPSDAPFSKIKVGMSSQQVRDLIGNWKDSGAHATGKAYLPFYFGSDTVRSVLYYKDQGRIITSSGKVVKIEYDPTEDGYK